MDPARVQSKDVTALQLVTCEPFHQDSTTQILSSRILALETILFQN